MTYQFYLHYSSYHYVIFSLQNQVHQTLSFFFKISNILLFSKDLLYPMNTDNRVSREVTHTHTIDGLGRSGWPLSYTPTYTQGQGRYTHTHTVSLEDNWSALTTPPSSLATKDKQLLSPYPQWQPTPFPKYNNRQSWHYCNASVSPTIRI